ncbi:MAG: hypothetical protein O3C12_06735, partial [Proteobacteria bacterium]|nr:hypothetical protein [Pseudomonadota bacterium]
GRGELVPNASEIFDVTATVLNGSIPVFVDISGIVTVNTGAIIGEVASLQFEATAVIEIIDAGNLTAGGQVGIGQPTIVE